MDVRLKDAQCDLLKKGACITLRNARSSVVKGHIKMVVDIWGKMEATEKSAVVMAGSGLKNISEQEYEAKIEDK